MGGVHVWGLHTFGAATPLLCVLVTRHGRTLPSFLVFSTTAIRPSASMQYPSSQFRGFSLSLSLSLSLFFFLIYSPVIKGGYRFFNKRIIYANTRRCVCNSSSDVRVPCMHA
ncbi:hypothetical protein GGS23DRAFT_529499 [Durotheca rogersii]|uniref:uncharacterized protein n=1 Tax=Durotheca rogersii TaxID=419775 RepID=UPI0022200E6F|nr:uncharacterized protein GGS23DRAFT_529499 [Durotheca rogersii]KAI5863366.1 hypothetical protein GGS23DRAFT_529499 [Durotheca rogersii]